METAIVEFQGRPYLIGLRHLRPLRESYLQLLSTTSTSTSLDAEQALARMKKLVEQCTPYRPYTMGEILKKEKNETLMTKFPKRRAQLSSRWWRDARTFLGYHYNHVTLPRDPIWDEEWSSSWSQSSPKEHWLPGLMGLTGIAVVEHNSDAHIHVKELYNKGHWQAVPPLHVWLRGDPWRRSQMAHSDLSTFQTYNDGPDGRTTPMSNFFTHERVHQRGRQQ